MAKSTTAIATSSVKPIEKRSYYVVTFAADQSVTVLKANNSVISSLDLNTREIRVRYNNTISFTMVRSELLIIASLMRMKKETH